MKVCYSASPEQAKRMTTEETRNQFLINTLFKEDEIEMVYSEIDRAIVGSAVPNKKTLLLEANKKEKAADYFAERREIGVIGGSPTKTAQEDKWLSSHRKWDRLRRIQHLPRSK